MRLIEEGGRAGPYSHMTPFNFEKNPEANEWLPLRRAIPKVELFAPIDDDHCHPGSSLQSRGLYPLRVGRQSYALDASTFIDRAIRLASKLRFSRNFILFFISLLFTPNMYKYNYIKSIFGYAGEAEYSFSNYYIINYLNISIHEGANILEIGSLKNVVYWKGRNVSAKYIVFDKKDLKVFSRVHNIENIILVEPELIQDGKVQKPYLMQSNFKGYDFSKFLLALDYCNDDEIDLIVPCEPMDFLLEELEFIKLTYKKLKTGGTLVLNNLKQSNINFISDKLLAVGFFPTTYLGGAPGRLSRMYAIVAIKKGNVPISMQG
jgi:hypothetical protein